VLEDSEYLASLREERSEEAGARIENLNELVSAAREYETREAEPSLAGFVDRLSLLSEADEESGSATARVSLMTLHAAKGLEFGLVVLAGLEEGLFPHARASELPEDVEEERRLCYVGMTRAQSALVLTSASRRRVFGDYQVTRPSRFVGEIPEALLEVRDVAAGAAAEWRWSPGASRSEFGGPRARPRSTPRVSEATPAYAYEDEDQSLTELRPGTRVRHPRFGVGTVLSVERTSSDLKLSVKFSAFGTKRLLASYARLERV